MGCSVIENGNNLASNSYGLQPVIVKADDVLGPPPTLSPISTTTPERKLELDMDVDMSYPSPVQESREDMLSSGLVDELIGNTVAGMLLESL